MATTEVLIVGGGISGLATARWLGLAGVSVELWEADDRPGGKVRTDRVQGYQLEHSANLMMNFRPEVSDFLRLSGLDSAVLPKAIHGAGKRYLVRDRQLVEAPTRLSQLFTSPFFTGSTALKLLGEPFAPRGNPETESVSNFIRRRLGDAILEMGIEPFIAGTLASDPDRANAASTLPRLCALEQQYGSIALGIIANKLRRRRTAMTQEIFSFRGGMATLPQTLASADDLRCRCLHRVHTVEHTSAGWQVTAQTPNGDTEIVAKHLVLSVPAGPAASLLDTVDHELAQLLNGIDYAPITVVHTGYNRHDIPHPLDGTGFLVPRKELGAINGNLWLSSLFEGNCPPDRALLTSYLGGARNTAAAQWSDARSLQAVSEDLERLLGITADPDMFHLYRHRQALPLYYGNYPQRCRAIGERLGEHACLHIEANYIGGVSLRDRIANSRSTAQTILAQLPARAKPPADEISALLQFTGA